MVTDERLRNQRITIGWTISWIQLWANGCGSLPGLLMVFMLQMSFTSVSVIISMVIRHASVGIAPLIIHWPQWSLSLSDKDHQVPILLGAFKHTPCFHILLFITKRDI